MACIAFIFLLYGIGRWSDTSVARFSRIPLDDRFRIPSKMLLASARERYAMMSSESSHASILSSPTMTALAAERPDGIEQHDNPLPRWWRRLFWGTFFFSLSYLAYYHTGGPGRSLEERYQAEAAANTKKQYAEIGDLEFDEATMVKYLRMPKWVGVGGAIYKANCVSCHATDGGGNVGPNLCDDQYKHIKQLTDIIKVVHDGVTGGAMPAWASRLGHKNDIVLVSVYVASLRGSQPANPKAPDGVAIGPWPTDSTATSTTAP